MGIRTFEESEIKKAEFVGGVNQEGLIKYSAVFIEINRLLRDKAGVDAKTHF